MENSSQKDITLPCISIIVPVYNSEKTLMQCLDSIIGQTFSDLEILLVNDGSTDSSFQICQRYAEKDPRIILINTPNRGVSRARNEGLKRARGLYIGFVDSDDWIDRDMYSLLYAGIQKNSSNCMAVVGVYARRWAGYLDQLCEGRDQCTIPTRSCIEEVAKPYGLRGYLWNKLFYNRKIYLDEESQVGEDLQFVVNYLLQFPSSSVSILNRLSYHYMVTEINDFSVLRYSFSKLYSKVTTFKKILDQLPADHKNAIVFLKSEICMTCYGLLVYSYSLQDTSVLQPKMQEIRNEFLTYYDYGVVLSNKKIRFKLFLLHYAPKLLIGLLMTKKRIWQLIRKVIG
jgi:glycosyltransferase involved in cell wall biosynthesis